MIGGEIRLVFSELVAVMPLIRLCLNLRELIGKKRLVSESG
jgi:hypothetical protein